MTRKDTEKTQTVKSQPASGVETLAQRIEAARKKSGATKEHLEQSAGLAKGYVSRLTRGQQGTTRPTAATIRALATALQVDPEWLETGMISQHPASGTRERSTPQPEFDRAAAALFVAGEVSEQTVERARHMCDALGDLDFSTWISVLADLERRSRKSET